MSWLNGFLDYLDEADLRLIEPDLAEVRLERNQVLADVDQPVSAVYLPIDSILSVVSVMRDGAQVESRTIGRESGHGLLHALGSPISYERMLVQVGGRAWRAPASTLRQAASRSPTLIEAVVRYGQATILQSALATACNSLHTAEQRLCRWLLLTEDRLGRDVLPLTQEHLAIMLGVQRTTVTAIASHQQAKGNITYVRGKIRILDRPAVERCACECYEAMTRYAALMAGGG